MSKEGKNKNENSSENGVKPEVYNISRENGNYRLHRRDFLKIASISSAVAIVAGCNPSQTQKVTEVVATEVPPTSTPTKTPTITPTITPSPTPVEVLGVVKGNGINFRTGPDTNYQSIGTLNANVPVQIVGLSENGSWYKVLVSIDDLPKLAGAPIAENGSVTQVPGWIKANLVEVKQGPLDDLPVEAAPPTPTPLPNNKPNGGDGVQYQYTDQYGKSYTYWLACGDPIPQGAVCVCNCVAVCSCDGYTAPACSCDNHQSGGQTCTCNVVSYWYPN